MVDMAPTPKYKIGDEVFVYSIISEVGKFTCPDCLDKGVWEVTSPAGVEHTIVCPRCSDRYSGSEVPNLKYQKWSCVVYKRTVGQVQTVWPTDDAPIKYMFYETGIGSGPVVNEAGVFPTVELAQAAGNALAEEVNSDICKSAEVMVKKHFSFITLKDAIIEAARSAIFEGWYAHNNLKGTVESIIEEDGVSTRDVVNNILAVLDYSKNWSVIDTTPLAELLKAVDEFLDNWKKPDYLTEAVNNVQAAFAKLSALAPK